MHQCLPRRHSSWQMIFYFFEYNARVQLVKNEMNGVLGDPCAVNTYRLYWARRTSLGGSPGPVQPICEQSAADTLSDE